MAGEVFLPGHEAYIAFTAAGGSQSLLCVKGHTLDLEAMLHDVSSTCTGAIRARIAGLLDVSGTINASLDLSVPPFLDPPSIRPGISGLLIFGLSLPRGKGIQVGVIVARVHYEAAVDKEVVYSFDVKANSLVPSGNLIVYPSASTA